MFRNAVIALATASLSFSASAAVLLGAGPYIEDFNSLPTATVANIVPAAIGAQAPVPQLTTWQLGKTAGTGGSVLGFLADNGSSTAGGINSDGTTGSSDRALGEIASGGFIGAFGVALTNSTLNTITSLDVSYTAEQWRSATMTANVLAFNYGLVATETTFLSAAGFLPVTALNAPGKAAVTTQSATDGNLAANQTAVSGSIPVVLLPGETVYIRWNDTNDVGNDASIAVDDLTITPNFIVVPEPSALALVGVAGLAALRRRRA